MKTSIVLVIATVALAGVGCHRARGVRAGTTTVTSAPLPPERMLMNDDAAMIVTKARCRREAQCNDTGAGGRFGTRDACLLGLMQQDSAVMRDELCPAGVDERRLSSCVDALLGQSCEVTRAGASAPAECQPAALCASPAVP